MNKNFFLDCTLRDGGYYNDWDFETHLVQDYLHAMDSLKIDFVETVEEYFGYKKEQD